MLKRRAEDLGERSVLTHGLRLLEDNMQAGRRTKALRFWTDGAVSRWLVLVRHLLERYSSLQTCEAVACILYVAWQRFQGQW